MKINLMIMPKSNGKVHLMRACMYARALLKVSRLVCKAVFHGLISVWIFHGIVSWRLFGGLRFGVSLGLWLFWSVKVSWLFAVCTLGEQPYRRASCVYVSFRFSTHRGEWKQRFFLSSSLLLLSNLHWATLCLERCFQCCPTIPRLEWQKLEVRHQLFPLFVRTGV